MAPLKKKGSNVGDPIWEHCSRINDNKMNLKCNYCGLERWGEIISISIFNNYNIFGSF